MLEDGRSREPHGAEEEEAEGENKIGEWELNSGAQLFHKKIIFK